MEDLVHGYDDEEESRVNVFLHASQPASHIHPAARAKPSCFKDGIVLFGISGTTTSLEVYWHIGILESINH